MWCIIKYKSNESSILIENLKKKLKDGLKIYQPKIKYQKFFKNKLKIFEKKILDNYLICHHEKFSENLTISNLKHTKGLQYFLTGCKSNQKDISNFVNLCKSFEDEDGYLRAEFFGRIKFKKGKFLSGPFVDQIFDIISFQGNKMKILIGGIVTTLKKNSGYYYNSV